MLCCYLTKSSWVTFLHETLKKSLKLLETMMGVAAKGDILNNMCVCVMLEPGERRMCAKQDRFCRFPTLGYLFHPSVLAPEICPWHGFE